MRILHYNILDGCAGEPERLAKVQAWVAAQEADVAGLAEMNGWETGIGMAGHAAACGFEFSHLVVGHSPYRLGLMAHEPIEVLDEITAGVHHGILHARIGGVEYVYSHFSPHHREMRIHEAQVCAGIVGRVDGPLVLMGDLNSHSVMDRELCERFATDENRAWAFDFEPQDILRGVGLVDIVDRRKGEVGGDRVGTLNTRYHKTGGNRWLDYMYVNGAFLKRYPETRARVERGAAVGELSDHFPVVCDCGEMA